jgi:hypothetical protein
MMIYHLNSAVRHITKKVRVLKITGLGEHVTPAVEWYMREKKASSTARQ